MARMQTTNAFYTKICKANIKKLNAAIVVVVVLLLCELSGELEWVGQKHDGVAGKGPADCLKVSLPPRFVLFVVTHTEKLSTLFAWPYTKYTICNHIFFLYATHASPDPRRG